MISIFQCWVHQGRVTHSSDTHGGQGDALVLETQLRESSDDLAGTGSNEGVTEGNGTTTVVNLRLIQAELADIVDTL